MVFVFLRLTSFSITISRPILVAVNGTISSFYSWVLFHCLYVPRFLHSFDCQWMFRLLLCPDYWNSAAMHIGVHVSFLIMVFSRFMPKTGTARSHGSSIFGFLRNLHSVLHSAVPIYISTKSVGGLPFLHTLSCICLSIFDDGHSDQYEYIFNYSNTNILTTLTFKSSRVV